MMPSAGVSFLCHFNALPIHGICEAAVEYELDVGHFGDVKLDGLRAASVYYWPCPVHEGKGTMRLIVDERADDQQRSSELYTPLVKVYQSPAEPEYPFHDKTIRVTVCGRI